MLYDTRTRTVETVGTGQRGTLRVYTCGPTVYRYAHVGNLRSYLLSDLIRRAAERYGRHVTACQNITDVGHLTDDSDPDASGEDKVLTQARAEGRTALEIARHYEDGFHADWALWKPAAGRTELTWPTPWGTGFPGWHTECPAMSLHYLGQYIDIHTGGIDLRFPHHENERAQSNAVTGHDVVRQWVHGEHLLFEGRRMSKSAGNVVLLSDLTARGLDPLALRLAFLEHRYRQQM